ncbi:hypothetical protein SAMN05192533_101211 [Mesobacillus persicus]|uniref:Uncharacterized protein n=1 Tax=Mesobacillus persicus TaxID=930146 RepID=A0A1H7W1T5_9BACI|nr:hypothetical protein [Mesobacillus persicus]SEM14967.1 hypothetical protein SAMN05192533_101211 [Mesobacillus persicus]
MIKKWTIAGIVYLLLVIGGYGIYTTTFQPDTTPYMEEKNH